MKNLRSIFYCVLIALVATVAFSSCKDDDKKGNNNPAKEVYDGFYVVGEATAVADLKSADAGKALMANALNEAASQVKLDNVYEKYIALEGGKSFTIVQKAGVAETSYGATLEDVVIDGSDWQVNMTVQKGALTANGTLQVATSGLYHVIVDMDNNNVWIAPVAWAINIDGTQLTTGEFSKTSIKFTAENVTKSSSGNFKYQYGGGWKITIAPGVNINANLGGTNAEPAPGGADITIGRGIFKFELTWTLAGGEVAKSYKSVVEKTESLAAQDFSACELELVGTGVASGNPGAVADGSSWNWGNVLSAGTPTVSGSNYTWTWSNVALLSGEENGFKVRTVGFAASGGIAAFDKGADIITSAPAGTSTSGNIVLPEDGNYNLVLTVNADEETYSLVITKL